MKHRINRLKERESGLSSSCYHVAFMPGTLVMSRGMPSLPVRSEEQLMLFHKCPKHDGLLKPLGGNGGNVKSTS